MKRSRQAIRAAAEAACAAFRDATPGKLGDLLFSDFSPGWLAPTSDVRDAWIAMGLDPDADLPAATDDAKAFSRAVEHAQRSACVTHDCRAVDLPYATGKRVAIMLITRNGTAKGETIGIVSLDRGATEADIVQADPYGICDGIKADARSRYLDRYTTDDVRIAVSGVLDRWAATPCRQSPPHIVYYLPAPGGDTLRRVRDALGRVGAGVIHFAPMGSDGESRETAASAANGGLEAQLSAFAAEAEQWTSSAPGRASTVETRIAELGRLRQTGELYRRILGDVVLDVDGRIAAIEASMMSTLGIVQAGKEART